MSKTNFVDGDPSRGILGTVVTADFLNVLNKHHHTGLDQDGHGALPYAADTGAANAYVVNLNPPLTQYVNGMPIFFKDANANTGACTIDVNTLGTKTIRKNITQDLAAGDIQAGQLVMVTYDGVNFQLIGGSDAHTVDGYHASATATASTVPIRDASSNLTRLDIITGNLFSRGTTSINFGSVTAGDVLMVVYSVAPAASTGSGWVVAQIGKTGTATVKYHNGYTGTVGNEFPGISTYISTGLGGNATPITLTEIIEVTGSGTLTIARTLRAYGISPTYSYEGMVGFFLKKQ